MDKTLGIGNPGEDIAALQRQSDLREIKALASQELKEKKEIDKAAGSFEALLLHEMLKAMWKTVETNGFLGDDSNEAQIYRDMLNQAVADSIAEGRGIGVKDFLAKEIGKQSQIIATTETKKD